jgi:hypothetical protein
LNLYLALQSDSVDSIGRSAHFYRVESVGAAFDIVHFDRTRILSYQTSPFHFTGPFWYHFIGGNFQHLPLHNSIYDFAKHVAFSPPSLYARNMRVMVMDRFLYTIRNLSPQSKLTINEISSFSREVYVQEMTATIVLPDEEFVFPIYICPINPESFSTVLLISTNLGVIPYSVTCNAFSGSGSIAPVPICHRSSAVRSNISRVRIPIRFEAEGLSVLYDSRLFAVLGDVNVTKELSFGGDFTSGFYVSFVHLMMPTFGRNVPVYVLVTPRII